MNCSGFTSGNKRFTDNMYESPAFSGFTAGIRPGGAALTEHLLELCGFGSGARIADIGCGSGYTAALISSKYGYDITGVDCSLVMLKRGIGMNHGLCLVNAESRSLPFRNRSMDGLLMECSLSSMSDRGAVLCEARRVLADDGKFAVSDIYIRNLDTASAEMSGVNGTCLSGAMGEYEIKEMFAASGFRIIIWEDQSKLWREFIAGLIMNQNAGCEQGNIIVTDELFAVASVVKPGYYSLIAVKG